MTIRAPMVVVTAAALLAGYPVVGCSAAANDALPPGVFSQFEVLNVLTIQGTHET